MKNLLAILLIASSLIGCSSMELEAISSSEEETLKILAKNLSHEENIIEAKKLQTPHMVSVVTLQLINARDEKLQADADFIESEKIKNMVSISENGSKFIGPVITKSINTGVLATDIDVLTYNLESIKQLDNESISHKLIVSLAHNSRKSREYSSANLCDEWNRCDENLIDINTISSTATNCSSTNCYFIDVLEVKFSDDFLKNSINKGFTLRVKYKMRSNKINVSKAYLMGYLEVVK
jgi:hypothetical protein